MAYDYTNPMLMFARLGILALFFSLRLKVLNASTATALKTPTSNQTNPPSKPMLTLPTYNPGG